MFNDSNSFYYCQGADVTNTTQRRHKQVNAGGDGSGITADDRFFWNKHMLTELIDSNVCEVIFVTVCHSVCTAVFFSALMLLVG